MKRFWFGVICMFLLLAVGFGSLAVLDRQVEPVMRELEQTLSAASSENWPLVRESLHRAKTAWEDSWHLLGSFLPHAPMEEADALLAELETHLGARESLSFQSICTRLLSLLSALREGQKPLWWNLL